MLATFVDKLAELGEALTPRALRHGQPVGKYRVRTSAAEVDDFAVVPSRTREGFARGWHNIGYDQPEHSLRAIIDLSTQCNSLLSAQRHVLLASISTHATDKCGRDLKAAVDDNVEVQERVRVVTTLATRLLGEDTRDTDKSEDPPASG